MLFFRYLTKQYEFLRALVVLALTLPQIAMGATFVVNSFGEGGDAFPGDGVAEVAPGSAVSTLHAAIEEANAFPGPDTIIIALAPNVVCRIDAQEPTHAVPQYVKPLPPLNDPTGGTTIQIGSAMVFDGSRMNYDLGATEHKAPFVLLSSGNRLMGLSFVRFSHDTIVISGPNATDNLIEDCSLGYGCPVMEIQGSGRDGIVLENGAHENTVQDNQILDCGGHGIRITGEGTDQNTIVRNYVGQFSVDASEVCDVHVDEIDGRTQLVPAVNVCTIEEIERAYGDFASESTAPNAKDGISIEAGASDNIIGGVGLEYANFIAGPNWESEYVLEQETGETKLLKSSEKRNLSGSGVVLDGAGTTGNQVLGNYIGYRNIAAIERIDGEYFMYPKRSRAGLSKSGVIIRNGASNNVIGSTEEKGRNRIAYSSLDAVIIEGEGTSNNRLINNYFHSETNGVTIRGGASNNLIGEAGTLTNLITAGNYGIDIYGAGTSNNTVYGNEIHENEFSGISIHEGAKDNIIGGPGEGEGNNITLNYSDGVVIYDIGTENNIISGNNITDNGEIGVFITGGASSNIIGGTTAGSGNDISNNVVTGVEIHDELTTSNRVLGNRVANNGTRGIFMVDGTSGNVVGGEPEAERNQVVGNVLSGIEINGAMTSENQIRLNSIYDNGEKGIFLSFGGNGGIVPPTLDSFVPVAGTTYAHAFVDIFVDGAEEGELHIGTAIADETGHYSVALDLSDYFFQNLTTTVTDSNGNTSEFSLPLDIIPPSFTDVPEEVVIVEGDSRDIRVTVEGSPEILVQWRFRNVGGSYGDLSDGALATGTASTTLTVLDTTQAQAGFYQCVADNGLGAVTSSEIYVRVVSADIRDLAVNTLSDVSDGDTENIARLLTAPGEDGKISLREALAAANMMAGANTISFGVSGEIALTEGLPTISDGGLSLRGNDLVVLDGALLSETGSGLVVTSSDNTISGLSFYNFPENGLVLSGSDASGNVIESNRFGSDGTLHHPNGMHGILITEGAHDNQIGGPGETKGNLMAGNQETGLAIVGSGASSNRIEGNRFVENTLHGVLISEGAQDTRFGSTLSGGGNEVVGNLASGLVLSGAMTTGTVIEASLFADNGVHGIFIAEGAHGNLLGGQEVGAGNIVSGNQHSGVVLSGSGTTENRLEGNRIGTVSSDMPETGNGIAGVLLESGASLNVVGGEGVASRNVIQGNTGIGVWVVGGTTDGNTILNNQIYDNGDLGIRLFEGGNNGLSRPVLTNLDPIMGTAAAGSRVDCFIDRADEGEIFLLTLTADGSGAFSSASSLTEYDGRYLTATATDSAGNTSAFSVPAAIDFSPPSMTLNGNATVVISCDTTFVDPGVLALDNIDGNITPSVVRTIEDEAGMPVETLMGAPLGRYTLRYNVTDSAGFAAPTLSREVVLLDSTPPTLTLLGEATVTVACGDGYEDAGVMASDTCDVAPSVQVTGAVNSSQSGSYTITYTAMDGAGNVSEPVSRSVTVRDTTPPIITRLGPEEITVECGVPYVDPGVSALDDCDGARPVSKTGAVDISRPGTYALMFNAIDLAGNEAATVGRVVTVVDTTAPVLTLNGAAEITLNCGESYTEPGASLVDSCDPGADVVISGDFQAGTVGTYEIRYDAVDTSGNVAATVTRTVTVMGDAPPQILLNGAATLNLSCDEGYTDLGARAVDACLGDISDALEVDNPVLPGVPGSYVVRYDVTDGSGVAATTVTRVVTILACARPCESECVGEADDAIDVDGDGLSKCKEACVGTSDTNPDSDGDGMSDGYEYTHQLDPLTDDTRLDPDLDGVVNLDEFLENASPRNASVPVKSFFVSPNGVDEADNGLRTAPWQSLVYALSRVVASANSPAHIYLESGTYVDDVTIGPWITVSALEGAEVVLTGTVVAEANTRLIGIRFMGPGMDSALLYIGGGNVTVRGCVFDGSEGTGLTGIVVEEGSAPSSAIAGCDFMALRLGIDVVGRLPAVRHNRFFTMDEAAIVLRATATTTASDGIMGEGLNGWNDFSMTAPGLALINELATSVTAHWNEWGGTSAEEIAAVVDGMVSTANALATGGAAAGSGVHLVVTTAGSATRIAGASVRLSNDSVTMTGTTDGKGMIAYPALVAGTYDVVISATGHRDKNTTVVLEAGMAPVYTIPLTSNSTPDPDPDPGDGDGDGGPTIDCYGSDGGTGSFGGWMSDMIVVAILLVMFTIRRNRSLQRVQTRNDRVAMGP